MDIHFEDEERVQELLTFARGSKLVESPLPIDLLNEKIVERVYSEGKVIVEPFDTKQAINLHTEDLSEEFMSLLSDRTRFRLGRKLNHTVYEIILPMGLETDQEVMEINNSEEPRDHLKSKFSKHKFTFLMVGFVGVTTETKYQDLALKALADKVELVESRYGIFGSFMTCSRLPLDVGEDGLEKSVYMSYVGTFAPIAKLTNDLDTSVFFHDGSLPPFIDFSEKI